MADLLGDLVEDAVLGLPDVEKRGPERPALGRYGVELAGPVLGEVPLGADPAVLLEPAEKGIEGILLELVAQGLHVLDHRVAVHVLLKQGQGEDVKETPVHLRFERADVLFSAFFFGHDVCLTIVCDTYIVYDTLLVKRFLSASKKYVLDLRSSATGSRKAQKKQRKRGFLTAFFAFLPVLIDVSGSGRGAGRGHKAGTFRNARTVSRKPRKSELFQVFSGHFKLEPV